MLITEQKQRLILAFTNHGYNYLGAVNEANGPNAEKYYQEYCTNPVDDFFNRWLNKGLDYDGVFGNQCVDVFKYFNREVVHGPEVSGNAIDYWNKYPTKYYTRIENTITAIPQKGDVAIFGVSKLLPLGHIVIVDSANLFTLKIFEQNWPTQGYYDKKGNFIGTGTCHFRTCGYLSPKILGWLRPKNLS